MFKSSCRVNNFEEIKLNTLIQGTGLRNFFFRYTNEHGPVFKMGIPEIFLTYFKYCMTMTNVKHAGDDPFAAGMSLDELGLVAGPGSIALQRGMSSRCSNSNSSIICGINTARNKKL